MSIDIRSEAQNGEAVKNLRCVGCGHCADVCPARTLSSSTKFLNKRGIPSTSETKVYEDSF